MGKIISLIKIVIPIGIIALSGLYIKNNLILNLHNSNEFTFIKNNLNNMEKEKISYNTKIKYSINEPIEFSDFVLTYVKVEEDRPVGGGLYNVLITKSIFTISDDKNSKEISWSSRKGPEGEYTPVNFEFNGKNFVLEKGVSKQYGILQKDELVIIESNTNISSVKESEEKGIVTEIKTFSDMPEITFDYPVFKNWGIKSIVKKSDSEYVIYLDSPIDYLFEQTPQITIKKTNGFKLTLTGRGKTQKNNFGVFYEYFHYVTDYVPVVIKPEDWGAIHFFKEEKFEQSYGIVVPIGPEYEFDRDVFAKKVIETFRFVE